MSSTSSSSGDSLTDKPVGRPRRARRKPASPSTSGTDSPVLHARGRGRGRGKGKGPATKRSRKTASQLESERAEAALAVIQTRKDRFTEHVKTMEREELQDLVLGAFEEMPALLLDLYEPTARGDGGYHPPEGSQSPDWCVCGRCREMPSQAERICCKKHHCISQQPDFSVLVLDPAVLALARLQRKDILLLDDEDDEDRNKANRYAGYRQYVLWTHGRLGVGNRKVIPSCCVWAIRDNYPNPFNTYRGFVPARLV